MAMTTPSPRTLPAPRILAFAACSLLLASACGEDEFELDDELAGASEGDGEAAGDPPMDLGEADDGEQLRANALFCSQYEDKAITLRSTHGRYVSSYLDGSLYGKVRQFTNKTSWGRFVVRCTTDGGVTFRTSNGRFLRAGDDAEGYIINNSAGSGFAQWERFDAVTPSSGRWAFLTAHGRWMRAGYVEDSFDVDQATQIGGWEYFDVDLY